MDGVLDVVIPAAITLAGVLIAAAVKTRADAVAGYASLVDALQEELVVQRERLAAFETRLDAERATWAAASAEFQRKIDEQAARIAQLEATARQLGAGKGETCP